MKSNYLYVELKFLIIYATSVNPSSSLQFTSVFLYLSNNFTIS